VPWHGAFAQHIQDSLQHVVGQCNQVAPRWVVCDHRLSYARLRADTPKLAAGACPAWGSDTSNGREFGVCCVLQPLRLRSEVNRLGDQLTRQTWLWCVAAMLVYLAWLLWLQRAHFVAQRVRASHNVSAADFAVWISHAGCRDVDKKSVEKLGRHYGKVILAAHVLTVGRVLSKCTEVGPYAQAAADYVYVHCSTPVTPRSGQRCLAHFLCMHCCINRDSTAAGGSKGNHGCRGGS
jgi:hypothetical protein